MSKLSTENVAYELPTFKMLADKLTILESKITNTTSRVSGQLLDSKEKQISLLMHEITEKNKETEKLKKANSSISSNKDKMNQLKQASAIKNKNLEVCKMSLKIEKNQSSYILQQSQKRPTGDR